MTFDAVVIGGGPAGSAVGRLLTEWGHSVLILTRAPNVRRGLAESLPPSTRKVLAAVGVLERVDQEGFCRSTGNIVWWGSAEGRMERFGDGAVDASGYQVFRPALDRLLLTSAADVGAHVCPDATVQRVRFASESLSEVAYRMADGTTQGVACRFALDCSGRAGVIARRGLRRRQPGYRTQALVGVWRRDCGWDLSDETRTLVETYADGWAWSIPISPAVRHVTMMTDPNQIRAARHCGIEGRYRSELVKTQNLKALVSGATLEYAWGCDASLYTAQVYGGSQYLLVGDAASFIDPLSSVGVKKALTSAWIAAVVVHTCLTRPSLQQPALDFRARWEREVYAASLRRSVQYAREAAARYSHPFWLSRAGVPVADDLWEPYQDDAQPDADVLKAFERLKQSPAVHLWPSESVRFEQQPAIRGREIVLENGLAGPMIPVGLRFLSGVDLAGLVDMVSRHRSIPDLFQAYCQAYTPVPLPNFLRAVSVLLAKRVVESRES
jgi:flavin-dependent dehydrogenase